MPENFPLMPVTSGGPTSPIETPTTAASPHPVSEGGIGNAFSTAYRSSPVVTGMLRGYGDLAYGDQTVPQDKASAIVKAQGLDPAFIPKEGIGYGALQEEIQRQGEIKLNQLHAERSGGTSTGAAFVGGLGAGIADPSSLVLGPAAGAIADLARGGLALRSAVGAAEGATYQFGMSAGQAHMTGHDDDILSWQTLHDTTFAGLAGATGGAIFGPRALKTAAPDLGGYRNMIVAGENSAAYAKKFGGSVDNVVSLKGAVGKHQVMPGTARDMIPELRGQSDKDVTTWLRDPANNERASTAYLGKLHKQFGDDPEAIAIAYNAGPGAAERFIKAGRDRSVLATETRQYLNRIAASGGKESFGAASPYRPNTFSMDWTNGESVNGTVEVQPKQPTVAYHGTNADFENYDPGQGGKYGAQDAKGVSFFSSDPDVAAGYGDFASLGANRGEGVNIRPVRMQLENPKEIDWGGEMYSMTKFKAAIAEAKAAGHDGVIFKNVQDDVSGARKPSDIYAVFDANKSTTPHFGQAEAHAAAQTALQQFAADQPVQTASFLKGLGLAANLSSKGEIGPSSPIWYNTRPAGLSEHYMGRFGGIVESVADHKMSVEQAKAEFQRQGGHIPADWADKLPEFFREGGPVSRLVNFAKPGEDAGVAEGSIPHYEARANDGSIRPAAPPLPEDFHQGLMQRFGIGTKYGPAQIKQIAEAAAKLAGDEPKPEAVPEPIQQAIKAQEAREAAAPLTKGSPAEDMAQSTQAIRNSLPEDHHEAFDEAVKAAENEPEAGTKMLPKDFDKAVNAAVKCGVLKGASYAGD